MIIFFRRLSLTAKLFLIGLIPIALLLYFSYVIYKEKDQKLAVMHEYVNQVEVSAVLASLNESLGYERMYSFHFLLEKTGFQKMMLQQRIKTDSLIKAVEKRPEVNLKSLRQYTFLTGLDNMRNKIDSIPTLDPNNVIDFYTRCIFRINYTNSWVPPSNIYLTSDYQDIVAQRLLRQMITLIDILRTNIYNALYTKKYMVEILMGSYGSYTFYQSLQKEFKLKASDEPLKAFDSLSKETSFAGMNHYMDTLFAKFHFDSSMSANQWWQLSTNGINAIKDLQRNLWTQVDNRLNEIYSSEKRALSLSLFFLLAAILLVILFISYIIHDIRIQLRELKMAARKISRGEAGITLENFPHGMLGSLAKSILQIEKNNLVLAQAAREIGTGNFQVKVNPRSENDILAMSIKKMKQDLRRFTEQKDKLQKETMDLVTQRDQFFSMTSHELKTPVTTLKAYAQMLLMDGHAVDEQQHKEIFKRMEKQIGKLVLLINDLIDISRLQYDQLVYENVKFKFNQLVAGVISELQISHPNHRIIFQKNVQGEVCGDAGRISQAVANLLNNAIKYSPDSRDIIVRIENTGESIIFSVKDFGYGIRDEEKEKIFERFYRVSNDNMDTYPGLGIGLYISRQIIQKHNGKIWCDSEFGKGSTFYFELPLAASITNQTEG